MSEPITYVAIDAHKAELQVALLAPHATEPVAWTVRNEAPNDRPPAAEARRIEPGH